MNISDQFLTLGLELQVIQNNLPEDCNADLWQEKLDKIQRRLDRIGTVNLLAIDEFSERDGVPCTHIRCLRLKWPITYLGSANAPQVSNIASCAPQGSTTAAGSNSTTRGVNHDSVAGSQPLAGV